MLNNKIYDMFLLLFFSALLSVLALSFVNCYSQEFDNISPINITKQDGATFEIAPTFIIEEGYKSFSNDAIQQSPVMLSPGDSIEISYISPCGYAESIEGFFLKGTADIAIKSLESTGPIQTMQISGEQQEFYKNQNPEKEGIVTASIPSDIEISAQDSETGNNNKMVFVMDCNEEKIYYIAEVQMQSKDAIFPFTFPLSKLIDIIN
ncbi:MAG: hypothetical protein MRJ93_00410 [Nitrososphaeraceae archaeon]|nr:hypothetical protein [Nitrososphaeraceae archaeon]